MSTRKLIFCLILAGLMIPAAPCAADGSMRSKFKDPADGGYDMSGALLSRRGGFLPVPVIITAPALGGFGLGAAVAYFHSRKSAGDVDPWTLKMEDMKPPSISAVAGVYTLNNSTILALAHLGRWRGDSIRYTGLIAGADINLDFYVRDDPVEINLLGFLLLQEILFRIGDSPFFLGAGYTFIDEKTTLPVDLATLPPLPGIDPSQNDRNAGAYIKSEFDSRDNTFTPDRGYYAILQARAYSTVLGGKHDYEQLKADLQGFFPISPVVLAAHLDVNTTTDGAPFYGVPYILMRGIPAMRYQGPTVVVAELEARWDMTHRWSLVGFGGIGSTYGNDKGDDYRRKVAGGLGIRYLLARVLGIRGGIDIARGPEDWTFYLTVGYAWAS